MAEIDEKWDLDERLDKLRSFLDDLDYAQAAELLSGVEPIAQGLLISRLREVRQVALLENLPVKQAQDIFEHLSDVQRRTLAEQIKPDLAAVLLGDLFSEECVDILNEMDAEDSEAILSNFAAEEAADLRVLMSYPEGTVGALMRTEYLSFPDTIEVKQIFQDLRANQKTYAGLEIQYAYIVDERRKLVGVLPLRNLLFAQDTKKARDVMIKNPASICVYETREDLRSFFHTHDFVGLPVVDKEGILLGVVEQNSLTEDENDQSTSDFLKVSGLMGKDEIRAMPLWLRSRRRLSWLTLNIVLNLISVSIISLHEHTLQAVIALAFFLPLVSDMSGCSGNQAVAVSLRELSLNLLRPTEFLRVFMKESSVGLINGICLGIIVGIIAALWKGGWALGLVIGGALAVNTIIAVCVGGIVPLLLKWRNLDPALASGPILTTVTDMCGFMLVLSLASVAMPWLI